MWSGILYLTEVDVYRVLKEYAARSGLYAERYSLLRVEAIPTIDTIPLSSHCPIDGT